MHSWCGVPFDFLENMAFIVITFLGWLEGLREHPVPLLQQLQSLQLELNVLLNHHPLKDLIIIRSPHLTLSIN